MTRNVLILSMVLPWMAWATSSLGAEPAYEQSVRPLIAKHCAECHGPEVQESDLRLDQLSPDLSGEDQRKTWAKVLKQLKAGKMPPKKKPRPAAGDIAAAVGWIEGGMRQEADRRKAEGRVVLRRLNRVQYENTVRDLLAIDTDLKDLLPEDRSAHGFDTVGAALSISPVLMESYLEAADAALNAASVRHAKPTTSTRRIRLQDEQMVVRNPRLFLIRDDSAVLFTPYLRPFILLGFKPSEPGRYRFRISASGYQTDRPLAMSVYAGDLTGREGQAHLVGYYDLPPDRPTIIEFEERLGPRQTIKLLPYALSNEIEHAGDAAKYRGPGVAVQWIDIEGPLAETWPPESHRRLFDDLPLRPIAGAGPTVEVVSNRPREDAERLLRQFVPRAFRRPVDDELVRSFVAIVWERLDAGYGFEEAMRVGYKAVLCAPEFLFFLERPGRLDDFALAARLSYFLWSSIPDEALLEHARAGDLSRPEVLRAETERLLKDPRAHRFTADFLGQWLDLRQIDDTTPDAKLYPEFDELLQASMVRETELFFEALLADDLGVQNVIDSDFAMLNERLARHYGIAGVVGQQFRRVELPPGSHRGGLLTQASVLKVTANGTNTSPVRRGVWVLKNILGAPPEPPPQNVPALEPDIRGATTIRAQLAQHRNVAACASCHQSIDPPGFALESFDVVGGWRDSYRILAESRRGTGSPQAGGGNQNRIRLLLTQMDANKDGQIEKAEVPDEARGPFQQLLRIGDTNKDGKLDRDEVKALLDRLKGGSQNQDQGQSQGQERPAPAGRGRNGQYRPGPRVDAGDVLSDGRRFRDIDGFKQLLLADKDQVVRCLAEKLLIYATGAGIDVADRPAVDAIAERVAPRNYGLRSLVHEVVQSDLFRIK